jgi:thiosulfate/3-mercaptopyruvate sulfurtransferase
MGVGPDGLFAAIGGYLKRALRVNILNMRNVLVSSCHGLRKRRFVLYATAGFCLAVAALAFAATDPWSQSQVIQPKTLARQLQGPGRKPLLLQVGFERLYDQGHIPGSKYCGPASTPDGIAKLKSCVEGVPHNRAIVLYCGCCPWQECPNIRPAFKTLKSMGFTDVKVVQIDTNFGHDWAKMGFPVATGR